MPVLANLFIRLCAENDLLILNNVCHVTANTLLANLFIRLCSENDLLILNNDYHVTTNTSMQVVNVLILKTKYLIRIFVAWLLIRTPIMQMCLFLSLLECFSRDC